MFVVCLASVSAHGAELKGKVVGATGKDIRVAVDGDLLPQPGDLVTVSFEVPGLPPVRVGSGKVTRIDGEDVLATLAQTTGQPAIDQLVVIDCAVPMPRKGRRAPATESAARASSSPRVNPSDLPPMPEIAGGPLPYLGMGTESLTPASRRRLDLPDFPGGIVVRTTETGGPARAAGIRIDDVLRRCDGREISRAEDLAAVVGAHQTGDALKLEIWRQGKPLDVTVTIADRIVAGARSCDAGAYDSCESLAVFFEHGRRVAKDPAVAAALLARSAASARTACDGGDTAACEVAAALYESGRGVAADPARALAARRQACDGGSAEACRVVGHAYVDGQGVAKDPARAAVFFDKGCEAGCAPCCTRLGFSYERGEGVAPDAVRAVTLLKKACDGGDPSGCSNLGVFYYAGQGVAKDVARAAALMAEACEGGVAHACKNVGRLYELGDGVPRDLAKARSAYERACEGGSAEGCGSLGVLHKKGIGVKKDGKRAKELLDQACRASIDWACAEAKAK
jgi:TPR repeat protein